jgi:hypothetical protein
VTPVVPSRNGEIVQNGNELWTRIANNDLQGMLSEAPRPGKKTADGWIVKYKMADQSGSWVCARLVPEVRDVVPVKVRGIITRFLLKQFAEAVETVLLTHEQEAYTKGISTGALQNDTLVKEALESLDGMTIIQEGSLVIFSYGEEHPS